MGDAGEGLVDNEARLAERQEELERARRERNAPAPADPARSAELESLRLARVELQRQLDTTSHDARRAMLTRAIAELDRRIADGPPRAGRT